ncbi:MAG TPA: shikimate kinase [Bacteroidales bacterium]|nr:shikimate kinase [Bacteroidales bacterium]
MRYFIIGFKNSGKTTFGRELAKRLQLAFIDLDEFIERKENKSIPEIYSRLGEERFRMLEWKALQEVVHTSDIVISTGGGAPCHCDNMTLMETYGDVIYLKVSDHTLVERLKMAAEDRPIVKGKTADELRQYVTALRERCEHHYLRAKYIVDGDNLEMESVVKSLAGLSER